MGQIIAEFKIQFHILGFDAEFLLNVYADSAKTLQKHRVVRLDYFLLREKDLGAS